jgi:hypothetical protein
MTEENADTGKVWAEIEKLYGWRWLIGSQEKVEITEEWKKEIWYCPSCKYWFPIDWNHDDEVCCACAGCTKHPFLKCMVNCQCPRCQGKPRVKPVDIEALPEKR